MSAAAPLCGTAPNTSGGDHGMDMPTDSCSAPESPADPAPPAVPATVADHLARHVDHVLVNTAEGRSTRSDGAAPVLDAPVAVHHARPGAVLVVDDVERDAVLIDTDPDVVGWGAEVDGSIVLVVVPRDRVPLLDLRLTSLSG